MCESLYHDKKIMMIQVYSILFNFLLLEIRCHDSKSIMGFESTI